MKRAAQHDAGDATNDRRRHVPSVIRNAVDAAWERPAPAAAGYGAAVPFQMALAHRWARYDDVASALRALANLSLLEQPAREDARGHPPGPVPALDAGARFPEAEVFLSVDHGRRKAPNAH
ncbi:hypothetical protein BAE44_0014218 [Dichanthelium oligosanthes]|uniref:Uncharacterized protein n=1 Tax=Dichanthelium oligosanthes TaxID=888268 RepID=A0A1E5VI26_9POAL|nr:hypothetical protein BAE44_0014218 [Dichanthelium oligosanthes]